MSALTDDKVLDRIGEVGLNDTNKLREKWETIQEDQELATMSTGSRFIENTVSGTVFHGIAAAGCFCIALVLMGFSIRKVITIMKTLPRSSFMAAFKEMTFLMAPDTALITILIGAGLVEAFNAALSKIRNVAPSVYVPLDHAVVQKQHMSSRFMQINEYVPNKASLASMNRALRDEGIPQELCSIDVEGYTQLQNIQNYVSLSTISFRNSCAFGLDTILGKMMSKAEQDIDYEFVKRFEIAVAERDEYRSLLLKHMHSVGLGQDTLREYTHGSLNDLYGILVENGIHLELPEVAVAVKDKDSAVKIIRESGLPFASKVDALNRERQLVSLAAASQSMSVSRTFKKREILAAFSGSTKSVRDEVDEALAKDVRVEATFRNMNGRKMEELTREILLVSEMIHNLSSNCTNKRAHVLARSMCIQITLISLCMIVFTCYMVSQKSDSSAEVSCYRYMATRYPRLVNGMDIEAIVDDDLPAIIDPILSEPSNYKLRTRFSKCQTDSGVTLTNKLLSISLKYVVGVTVLFALIAGIRTHFRDAFRQMEEETESLLNLQSNLKILVEAVDDTGPVPMLEINKVKDLQLVVGNIKMFKNKVSYLVAPEDAIVYPKLGKVAKYAITACLALTAVFIVVKKMDPSSQLRRMRELKQTGGRGSFSGGGAETDALKNELHMLRGEGGAKETHTITLLVMLAVSAFTTVQLSYDILSG